MGSTPVSALDQVNNSDGLKPFVMLQCGMVRDCFAAQKISIHA